jgi:hypothetical protein
MSDDSPEKDPLGLFDTQDPDMSEEDRAALTALQQDLSVYDNPAVFYDPDLDLLARFRIHSTHLTDKPDTVRVEIEGDNLFLAVREAALTYMRESVYEGKNEDPYTDENWEQTRAATLADQLIYRSNKKCSTFSFDISLNSCCTSMKSRSERHRCMPQGAL